MAHNKKSLSSGKPEINDGNSKESSDTNKVQNMSDEIDIGQLFQMMARAISRFFIAIGALFISILLFLRKKLIYLLIGAFIGGGTGLFTTMATDHKRAYKSSMVIESWFSVGPQLYGIINHLNLLVRSEDKSVLAEVFEVSEKVMELIEKITITPIVTDSDIASIYDKRILFLDTIYQKILPFEEFKSGLSDNEYPRQTIAVYAKENDVFSKLETPILSLLNNSPFLQTKKAFRVKSIDDRIRHIKNALKQLDSTNVAFRQYLTKESSASQATFYFKKGEESISLHQLMDRYLSFSIELEELNEKKAIYSNVFNVIKPLSHFGEKTNYLTDNYIFIGFVLGGLLVFIILSILEFNKYLSAVDRKRGAHTK